MCRRIIMISDFSGENYFLANEYPCHIFYDGFTYETVEQAYQSVFERYKEEAKNKKKYYHREWKTREWRSIKIFLMETIINRKFEDPYLADLLLNTGNIEIVHLNQKHNDFWGVCECPDHKAKKIKSKRYQNLGILKGRNYLGQVLMMTREKIKTNRDEIKKLTEMDIELNK